MSSLIKRSRSPKIEISYGMKIGYLQVGEMIHMIRHHECFPDTSSTYIRMGGLRECLCTRCGNKKLIPEALLSQNEMRSCGCLRRSIREQRKQASASKKQKRAELNILNYEISLKRADLAKAKLMYPCIERNILVNSIGDELRILHARKGGLATVISKSEMPQTEVYNIQNQIDIFKQKLGQAELALYKIIRLDGTEEVRAFLKDQIRDIKQEIKSLSSKL